MSLMQPGHAMFGLRKLIRLRLRPNNVQLHSRGCVVAIFPAHCRISTKNLAKSDPTLLLAVHLGTH